MFLFSIAQPARSLPRYDGDGRASISGFDAITLEYGFTPCELASSCDRPNYGEALPAGTSDTSRSAEVRVHRATVWLTLLTAMFMHGGWLHLSATCCSCRCSATTSRTP